MAQEIDFLRSENARLRNSGGAPRGTSESARNAMLQSEVDRLRIELGAYKRGGGDRQSIVDNGR